MDVDIGSETSKLHAKRNSTSMSLTDSLWDEMPKALAIAVGTTVVKAVLTKSGEMIFNILKRKADDEADDEADGLQNNYGRLMELKKKLSLSENDILVQTKPKLVTQVFEDWISGAKKSIREVQELQDKYTNMGCDGLHNKKRRSQHGSSESRTSLSKRMAEKCYELDYQFGQGSNIRMQVNKLPDLVIIMPGPMREDDPFLLPYVEVILDHLRNENINRIGILGGKETGTTAIMMSLNNNEHAAEMFDIIIWVSASEDLDFNDLQHIIAGRLKLNVEGITNSDEIYHQICKVLKGKRYLLLLDEVSGSFDPSWIGCYGYEKDSKVVLTARFRPVCLRMKTNVVIPVEPMSRAVARKIFQEKVGRNVNLLHVRPIAELVADACQGSPLVIDKVAIKFRERDTVSMWVEGLRILQGWPGTDIDHLVELLST